MKDYELGQRLFNLRKQIGYSQMELAYQLGVTNKAVSKWENGEAAPSIEQLIKLSEFYNISVDEILKSKDVKTKQIFKIALTGGPCSGKSTAMSWIQNEFSKKGYRVVFVPETATEMIIGGLVPNQLDSTVHFQTPLIDLQLKKEKIFEDCAKHFLGKEKVLIVCDRGALDPKAYMTENEFQQCLKNLGTNEVKIRDSYDAVFHLITAANGAREFYNLGNKARKETPEEAIELDNKTLNAWVGHPRLRVIDNSTDFQNKMRKLLKEISLFLGEPEPYEIERKFLIEYPNIELLEKLENCSKVEIIQTYLKNDNSNSASDVEVRVRQRGQNGHFTYTKTIKEKINNMKRIETESRISKDEYLNLLLNADTTKMQIRKTRYCLTYNNQYFEIDIYPFWNNQAIMEIELANEKQEIDFPKFIKRIQEVTEDPTYRNASLALGFHINQNGKNSEFYCEQLQKAPSKSGLSKISEQYEAKFKPCHSVSSEKDYKDESPENIEREK